VRVLVLVGERLRPAQVPVPVHAQAQVPHPLPLQLWGVVDLLERVPKSDGHHPERAVVPDRGYSW
jgi:hypothetical protein